MAKNKWSLGSYSRFIKAARQREGLTLPQARKLYTAIRDRKGKPVFANDLKKPQTKQIAHTEATLIKQGSRTSFSGGGFGGFDSGDSGGYSPLSGHVVTTLEEWEQIYDDWNFDYDIDYYEGTDTYKED